MVGRSGFGLGAVAIAWLLSGGCSGGSLIGLQADAGGARADGGVDAAPLHPVGEACPAPTVGGSCWTPDTPPCWKTCGPARSGFRNCSCDLSGVMVCSACSYEPGADLSCFMLPNPVPACPPDPTNQLDQLPMAATPCQLDPCRPCGSSTTPGYRDTGGAAHVGFCVCAPSPTTGQNVYSCAGIADWPPQRPLLD